MGEIFERYQKSGEKIGASSSWEFVQIGLRDERVFNIVKTPMVFGILLSI